MLRFGKFSHKRGLLGKPALDGEHLATVTTPTPGAWSYSRGMLRGGLRAAPLTLQPPGHRPANIFRDPRRRRQRRGSADAPSSSGSPAPLGPRCAARGAALSPRRFLRGRGRSAAGALPSVSGCGPDRVRARGGAARRAAPSPPVPSASGAGSGGGRGRGARASSRPRLRLAGRRFGSSNRRSTCGSAFLLLLLLAGFF